MRGGQSVGEAFGVLKSLLRSSHQVQAFLHEVTAEVPLFPEAFFTKGLVSLSCLIPPPPRLYIQVITDLLFGLERRCVKEGHFGLESTGAGKKGAWSGVDWVGGGEAAV